jgi:hypothetical protein
MCSCSVCRGFYVNIVVVYICIILKTTCCLQQVWCVTSSISYGFCLVRMCWNVEINTIQYIKTLHNNRCNTIKSSIVYSTLFQRGLTMVYSTQNYMIFGLCRSSCILKTREHNVSETEYVSVLRWMGRQLLCWVP